MKWEMRWMLSWPKLVNNTRSRAVLCGLALALLGGCTLFRAEETSPLRQATAEQLMGMLQEQADAVQTMKGLFSAKISGGILPIGQRVQGTVHYQRPNAIRLRGFTAVGSELFEFVQADDQFRLRLPTMGREVTGRPSQTERLGNLARPFQLSVWAMSGVTGSQAVAPGERVQLSEDGDRYRLDVSRAVAENGGTPPVSRRIWFERRNLLVVEEQRLSPSGEVEATMQFDDYRLVGAEHEAAGPTATASTDKRLLRPFKISMKDGQSPGSIQVTFLELVSNEPMKPGELGHVS
jgi:hypothetical protein